MKALFNKLVHIVIMPCVRIPLLLEQRDAGRLPFITGFRLRLHLSLCKWCYAYARKMEQINRLLLKIFSGKQEEQGFKDAEVRNFKDGLRKKMDT